MKYKQYIITRGGKELGIAYSDIEQYILPPSEFIRFKEFMNGQTTGLIGCEPICYTEDFERFIKGLPNND